ncbi:hypothetical protein niasHS_008814 [Heterodera schachtii]|uniref:Uncharacterized protein n=1 Tax=Heterodera schachtii TaxID=97005 RepID=A0ABD2J0F8_HETSC
MHVDFDPLQVDWSAFSSECVQFGGYNIYRGLPYQRGAGVGAVFRSLMRYLLPIGKQIGSAIGRQGMESGNRVLTNVLEGKDLKESLVSEMTICGQILSRIYLYLELSIEKPGANDKWVAIDDADTSVSAIQGIGQTFVQQLKVTVGNTEVYDSGNLYPFKAYITNELSFPINAKKNFLGSTGYYHTVNQDDSTDDGFKERYTNFEYECLQRDHSSTRDSSVVWKLSISWITFVSAFVDMYEALGMANSERSFCHFNGPVSRNGWTFLVIPLPSTLERTAVEFELLRKRYYKRTSNIQFTNSTWWR